MIPLSITSEIQITQDSNISSTWTQLYDLGSEQPRRLFNELRRLDREWILYSIYYYDW